MEKGNQHIAFDTLLALYHKELSLREVHQYKKHLEGCEVCQDVLDGIEAFDTTELLQFQPQSAKKTLEEKLLKLNKQHVRQTRYKIIRGNLLRCFPFLAASVLLIFFFPLNIEQPGKMDKTIQAENKISTPIINITENTQTAHNKHFTKQKKYNNNLAEKQISKANTPETKQAVTKKQTPVFNNLSKGAVASGLVEKITSPVTIAHLASENDEVYEEVDEMFLQNKKLIINDLEKIKTAEIPYKIKADLAPVQTVEIVHYNQPTEAAPVTPKFYAQYGLSHMTSAAAPVTDEIPVAQRIESNTTLIGSKISDHLVDVYNQVTGLDVAFGYQFNPHVGLELGTSYVYSPENLIDEEAPNRNYDRLYVTNRRFTLSPAFTLQTSREKWRPFARFGLVIPVAGQTQRRRLSDEAELVHYIMSFVESYGKYTTADYESDSVIKWRASLGYNAALGLRYQVNDVFDVFGTVGYTGLRMKRKTYEISKADLIMRNGDRTDILKMIYRLTHENYVNESANFSTINFSIGVRFNFGKK